MTEKERRKLKNTKRLLRFGETIEPGDKVWTDDGKFVDAAEVGKAGWPVRRDDFVFRPPENEDL